MHILHHYKWTRSHVNQKVSEVFQRNGFSKAPRSRRIMSFMNPPNWEFHRWQKKVRASFVRPVFFATPWKSSKPWMAHFCCCLRFWALKASIHHSLYGQQTKYEWRKMVRWSALWVAKNSAAFHEKFGLRIPTCPKDNRVVTNTLATQRPELNLSPWRNQQICRVPVWKEVESYIPTARWRKKEKLQTGQIGKLERVTSIFQTCWHKLRPDSVFKETCHRAEGMLTKARFSYCTL